MQAYGTQNVSFNISQRGLIKETAPKIIIAIHGVQIDLYNVQIDLYILAA